MQIMKASNAPYLLRWRFEFKDKPAVFGMWNSNAITAWDKNGEGLSKVLIECKSTVTKETRVVAECEGHEYRNLQWVATAVVPSSFSGTITPLSKCTGLKILTTDEEVAILTTGVCSRRKLTESEKGIHFATYGR